MLTAFGTVLHLFRVHCGFVIDFSNMLWVQPKHTGLLVLMNSV